MQLAFFDDPQQLMPLVYPLLGTTCLAISFLLFLTYWLWDRTMVILPLAIHFFLEAFTFLVLTLTTGHNPVLDINMFRTWIVWLRLLMFINSFAVLHWQLRRFSERKK